MDAAKGIGSETTKFVHSNKDGGLNPKGEYVEAALEKTAEGAGSVKLKAGHKTVYSSEQNKKTVNVPTDEVPAQKDDAAINNMVARLKDPKK